MREKVKIGMFELWQEIIVLVFLVVSLGNTRISTGGMPTDPSTSVSEFPYSYGEIEMVSSLALAACRIGKQRLYIKEREPWPETV